jgi:tripartite-type tricarboxylate transporter receptor subunit TctC
MTITGQGPAEFKAFMQKEIDRWSKVVKENGISAGS